MDLFVSFIGLLVVGGSYALVGYLLAVAAWAVIAAWSNKIARPQWRSMGWAFGFTAVLALVVSAAATPPVTIGVHDGVGGIGTFVLLVGMLVGVIGTIGGASLYSNIR